MTPSSAIRPLWQLPALLTAALLAGATAPAAEPSIPAPDLSALVACPVVRVISGDTLVVRVEHEARRIGLPGVRAPALDSPAGRAAQQWLAGLLKGESVYLVFAASPPQADESDRWPAQAYRAPDGLWLNLEMVRQGWAQAGGGPSFEHAALFDHFEQQARSHQRGQWDKSAATSQPARKDATAQEPGTAASGAGDVQVYVTDNGRKYHRANCPHVRNRGKPISLAAAKARGLTPCARCQPDSPR